jgi:hypothetical protein
MSFPFNVIIFKRCPKSWQVHARINPLDLDATRGDFTRRGEGEQGLIRKDQRMKLEKRVGVLSRFENSQNGEMTSDYFFSPSRRRSSLEEIAPSFFIRDRERSMIARNLRFVLRDTVSSSAFRNGTTAAKRFPFLTTITGSFLAFWAYFDNGSDAFFNSILVIDRLFLHRFELDFFL